ncbi:MAG: hypothetical protein U0556_04985 [Dehalococcoidia bacterium]
MTDRADELLNQFLDANGGRANWAALRNRVYRGQAVHPMQTTEPDYACTISIELPSSYRRDVETATGRSITVTDGVTTWLQEDNGPAQVLDAAAAGKFAGQRDKEIPFLDYQAKGFTLVDDGEEVLDGRRCHRLVLTQRNGNLREELIDAETFAWIGERLITRSPDGDVVLLQVFHDHRNVAGLTFPFQVDRLVGDSLVSRLQIEEMSINTDLGDQWFAAPVSVASNL